MKETRQKRRQMWKKSKKGKKRIEKKLNDIHEFCTFIERVDMSNGIGSNASIR